MQNLQIRSIPLIIFLPLFCSLQSFAQQPKKIRTIIVDAGHGGNEPGAHGEYEGTLGSYEKNITLAISMKLVAELKKVVFPVFVLPINPIFITKILSVSRC